MQSQLACEESEKLALDGSPAPHTFIHTLTTLTEK